MDTNKNLISPQQLKYQTAQAIFKMMQPSNQNKAI